MEIKDKLELVVRNNEVLIQPVKQFRSFRGSVVHKQGDAMKVMEEAAAKHVLETGK